MRWRGNYISCETFHPYFDMNGSRSVFHQQLSSAPGLFIGRNKKEDLPNPWLCSTRSVFHCECIIYTKSHRPACKLARYVQLKHNANSQSINSIISLGGWRTGHWKAPNSATIIQIASNVFSPALKWESALKKYTHSKYSHALLTMDVMTSVSVVNWTALFAFILATVILETAHFHSHSFGGAKMRATKSTVIRFV